MLLLTFEIFLSYEKFQKAAVRWCRTSLSSFKTYLHAFKWNT